MVDWADSSVNQCINMVFAEAYGDVVSYDWMMGVFLLVGFSSGVVALVSSDGGTLHPDCLTAVSVDEALRL